MLILKKYIVGYGYYGYEFLFYFFKFILEYLQSVLDDTLSKIDE